MIINGKEIHTVDEYKRGYTQGFLKPEDLIAAFASLPDANAWITKPESENLQREITALRTLESRMGKDKLPLFGIPFVVKDNIDARGFKTTAACPDFAYQPEKDSACVAALKGAGAILVGKSNLDQFATGLSGTRSPYGAVENSLNPSYICGGSSSGSAWVVARDIVPFSLGTDTAGSGRVPAGFNNIFGLKPSPGRVSTTGVVPACKSLDCVSIFSKNPGDAQLILEIIEGFDPADPYSRSYSKSVSTFPRPPRIGIPDVIESYSDSETPNLFDSAVEKITGLWNSSAPSKLPYRMFQDMASLLYDGPWVAERYAAYGDFVVNHPHSTDPSVRSIVLNAQNYSAVDVFKGMHRKAGLQRELNSIWDHIDVFIVPTAPRCYTLDEMMAEPVSLNSHLGHYTNFVNLAGWSAIAAPTGFYESGVGFGVTLIAKAGGEDAILSLLENHS